MFRIFMMKLPCSFGWDYQCVGRLTRHLEKVGRTSALDTFDDVCRAALVHAETAVHPRQERLVFADLQQRTYECPGGWVGFVFNSCALDWVRVRRLVFQWQAN